MAPEPKPIKLYRPSSGTESYGFFEHWCCQCARDKAMREGAALEDCDDGETCPIIALTYAHDVTEPEYPQEWRYDANGRPCCTAYVPAGQPIPPPVDDKTGDMFA